MTKTQKRIQSRRKRGVYLNKTHRRHLRNMLKILHGDRCCWCNKPMVFPEKGKPIGSLENMATLEHYFSKGAEEPSYSFLLRLSHKKCNR